MCEYCNGSTPLMIGAVRAPGSALVAYRVDVSETDGVLTVKTDHDESFVSIERCPMCGEPVGRGKIRAFLKRVEEYFHA